MTNASEGPFYPGRFNEDEKALLRASPLWPTVLAVHYTADSKLYVTLIGLHAVSGKPYNVVMGAINGLMALRIIYENGMTKIWRNENVMSASGAGKPIIESRKNRYIAARIPDVSKDPGKSIKAEPARLTDWMRYQEREAASTLAEQLCPNNHSMLSFDQSDCMAAVDLIFGGKTTNDIDSMVLKSLEIEWNKRADKIKRLADFEPKAKEMFGRIKWVVAVKPNYGVIVGAVDTALLIPAAMGYAGERSNVPMSPLNQIEPYRLHKSFDTIDARIKDRVMAGLAFCKVHREGNEPKNIACADDKGLVPLIDYVSEETNSIAYTVGTHGTGWMMLDWTA